MRHTTRECRPESFFELAELHIMPHYPHGQILLFTLISILVHSASAKARVTYIEILQREPFAEGMDFGEVGAYEVIRGRLHYAVDPDNPRNRAVVDLHRANKGRLRHDTSRLGPKTLGDDARNDRGEVTFAGDFLLLKPVDLSRGNHRLLYDVNNRGNLLMLSYFNDAVGSNQPRSKAHAGNGWLMRQGYSLLWSAWNWDVRNHAGKPLQIDLPIVVHLDGSPMTAKVQAELAVQDRDGLKVEWLAWGGSRCYPAAKKTLAEAVLTVRDSPVGERQVIPRDQWRFATLDPDNTPRFDPVHVYLPAGFEKGRLYELIYTAEHPRVVGLGLVAIRDAIAFFRFEPNDQAGNENPLLVDGHLDPKHAYIFGISQSGRVITHMIYQGFHVDENGRMVFDGARPHVPGAGKGGFNFRFAQTTHHPKHLQGNDFPADFFPFHYAPDGKTQHDPFGQPGRQRGDLLAEAKKLGKIPRILVSNHGGEYWTRSASLLHTDVQGKQDTELHENVRIYMINGVKHGPPSRFSRRRLSGSEHVLNLLDPRPVGRALLVALDQWVSQDIEPPPSRVPRIEHDELITAVEHQQRFPSIPANRRGDLLFPAVRHPGVHLRPARVDYGPRFWDQGIQDHVPPRRYGPRFVTLVPAIDADGNPRGGIQLPGLAVPLGTYQAFNPRHLSAGAPEYLRAFQSSFWPFTLTTQEQREKGDPRRSIAERYPSKQDYLDRISRSANRLVQERLMLKKDAAEVVRFAESLAWPPQPIDRWPFWVVQ